jgi:hypothetical protein
MVPDLCTVNVDIRLTLALDDRAAVALLGQGGRGHRYGVAGHPADPG